ncbi:MAG TPA: MscL family protein [Gaiellaceae bacterium]|nr:MscL family protein [Gaiellaceae bacterium]
MKGNALLIAAGVAVGYVAGQLILGVSNGIIAPLIGAAINKDNFIDSSFSINGNSIQYGYLIALAIALLLALALLSRRTRST